MNSNTNGMNKKGGYKKVFMRKRNSNNKRLCLKNLLKVDTLLITYSRMV